MITKMIIVSGKSAGRAIVLKHEKLLIGRAEECDVRPLSEEVSRRHCAVRVTAESVTVEDLASRNGTFVNGVRIVEITKVSTGDLIRVGSLELKVLCTDSEAKTNENDVSRWQMADDIPAGIHDTTHSFTPVSGPTEERTAAVSHAASSGEEANSIHSENSLQTNGKDSADSSAAEVTNISEKNHTLAQASGISKSASLLAIEGLKAAKSNPGMLAKQPKQGADSSRDAAAEALKKFFGNR